ncbi:MAG: helix-turn-helix domain-containing protein [Methylophagaceae bacterium]
MAQTTQLIDTLKRMLKSHGFSYADVAKQLSLSQASVKRLFSEQSFSLERLDKVCQMMEVEISDLVLQMNEQYSFMLSELTLEQEQEIAGEVSLLLITVCVLNRWAMSDLIKHFHLTEHQCIHCLAILDKLKLIDLLPGNKIKLKVASNFKWRSNGPIQQFFQQKLAADFFDSKFSQKQEKLIVINGMLSHEAMSIFHRKLTQLVHEFNDLNNEDAALPLEQRTGTTVVLATRNWQYGLFDSLRK